MSKFWEGGSSDSEEIEEEDDEVSWGDGGSDGEQNEEQGEENEQPAYVMSSDSDDDDDNKKRTVKSARVKRYEELGEIVQATRDNAEGEEKDFDKLWNDLSNLDAWMVRARNLVDAEGIPGPFLEMLTLLEDTVSSMAKDKEAIGALNKTQSKAFNKLKKNLPKHTKDYADKIAAYRANPDDFPEPDLNETQVVPDDDEKPGSTQPVSESGDWQPASGRVRPKKQQQQQPAQDKKWTDELINEDLDNLAKQRGRKQTDKKEQMRLLQELQVHAQSTRTKADVLKQIIAALFEFSSSKLNKFMKQDAWNAARLNIQNLLNLVSSDADYPAKEDRIAHALRSFVEQLSAEFLKSLQNIDPHTHEYVERLKGENHLLEVAANVQAYLEKLGEWDEIALLAMKRVEHMYYKLDTISEKLEVAHRDRKAQEGVLSTIVEKAEEVAHAVVEKIESVLGVKHEEKPVEKKEVEKPEISAAQNAILPTPQTADLDQLCQIIYKYGDKELKLRAMLCQVYHRALHDKYHQARDMVLMYNLQADIINADVPTQILFNRTMAQIGLCAFRKGYIAEAHSALADISTSKVREFLAQGIVNLRFGEKNPEQEKLEKQRQVPYHMHINLDLLEAVHLISAMLLEVPNLASRPFDVKPKYISRAFGRLLMLYERQVFAGPPETTRDFVLTAAKALEKGDWKRCEELLLNLPVWEMMHSVDQVKAMLRSKIQEAGLRTYLFTYGQHYDSLSLEPLCIMFDISHSTAHSIISKMMFNEELHASWDQPTGAIIMHKVEPSRLQFLALQYAEKLAFCVENNERILDARTNSYGFKYDQNAKGQKGNDRQRKGQNRNYGNQQGGHQQYKDKRQQHHGGEHRSGERSQDTGHNLQAAATSAPSNDTGATSSNPVANKQPQRNAWGGQQGLHRSSEAGKAGGNKSAGGNAWGNNAGGAKKAGAGNNARGGDNKRFVAGQQNSKRGGRAGGAGGAF